MRGCERRAQPLFLNLVRGDRTRAWIKALMADSSCSGLNFLLRVVILTSAGRPRPLVRLILSCVLANERGMIKTFGCRID